MTKLQYYTATSIDGYLAGENNAMDWLFEVGAGEDGSTGMELFPEFFANVGAMVMGSTTYEWIAAHHESDEWHRNYADTPCWVFSSRSQAPIPGANLNFVRGDVAPVYPEMTAAADGRNIWLVGGGELAGQFADQDLLDELIVGVAPVTLGAGAPLLPRSLTSRRLTLVDSQRHGQFVHNTYSVRPDPGPSGK